MKNTIGNIVLILLLVGLQIYLLATSVMDLTNTKDMHTVTLDGAFEVLKLKHSINGLIPIGTDYYYLGINVDTYDAYLIKASKKWLNNKFGSDHIALDFNGVQVTGLAKEISDYQTSKAIEAQLSRLEGVKYPLGKLCFINLEYKLTAILKLIDFVLILTAVIMGVYILKNNDYVRPVCGKLWIAVMVISLVLLIGIIR